MIYLDTSVLLATLLAQDHRPPRTLWRETLVSSRLLRYEVWNRLHARGLGHSHREAAESLLSRVALLELTPLVISRALDPFPRPIRTLDGLHLASCDHLRQTGIDVTLSTYDRRMAETARAMGFALFEFPRR